ncbi:pre-mRNA-splicing factor CWC22 homolog isoform X2 [Periplaneta americana]|uniref:pre-mRNA-splicing factor CWC22 homolog isoform X2 n=1 Tax=Periplaneta americana TaxID=6978 RepID=UPI0037E78FF4
MSSRNKEERNFIPPEYNNRAGHRKRAHSPSSDSGVSEQHTKRKKGRFNDSKERDFHGKMRDYHREDYDDKRRKRPRSRERQSTDEFRNEKEKRYTGREKDEDENLKMRHRDERKSKYSKRHDGREKPGKHSTFDSEKEDGDHGYWERKQSSHNESRKDDKYWGKYSEEDNAVGPRYYGGSSRVDLLEDQRSKNFEDKENLRESVKRRREVSEDVSVRNDQKGRNDDPMPVVEESKGKDIDKSTKNSSQTDAMPSQKKTIDMLTSRTGGAYIPPAKLRMMQAQITDKSSAAYQRIAWEALKKSIHGHINKVNTGNIGIIVRELLKENIVRGRGLLCRSIIQAQAASPTFTHVYAALVAVVNSKFPNIGELLLRRLVIQFRRGFKRNDKTICISAATFVAHLVNQRVAHEIVALEILTLLIESPTDDSVEVAIAFLKECGMKLMEVSNKGLHAIFEMLRNILHEGQLDKRVQYMIEVIFQVRKDEFRDHEAVMGDLDLVEEEDQFTHLITLDEAKDPEDILNVFKFDAEYEANEEKYSTLRKEILDEGSSDSESGSGSEEESGDEEEESENEENKDSTIIDNTETNLVALRRTIYLTIHSSLDFEECAHKLMRMELKPGQEIELCHMFLDCCAEQRTYEKFFGLLAQRFCQINKIFIPPFQQIFKDTYDTIHRLDTNKLRNVAKFFAHLLFTDAISWEVLSFIHLNEEETTSSSRIFIKILFQELSEYMGLTKLNERVKDPTLQTAFDGLFPRDDPKNTRFAINFFTSIGLGGLTDELREHLKTQPKTPVVPKLLANLDSDSSDSSSDTDSSDSSSTSSE